jgi:catechol 2,3-dioxygenase-like lactoylglutathione lyase family enzyme
VHETLLNKYAINHIGYYVKDLELACREHSALFGSGPFFYLGEHTMTSIARGREYEYTSRAAFGQFGDLQIEFIQVISDNPSAYKEMERFGLNHFSIWVDNVDSAIEEFENAGYEIAMRLKSSGGAEIIYFDGVEKWGHYLEVSAPAEGMYEYFKKAAEDWDGSEPYRRLNMGK